MKTQITDVGLRGLGELKELRLLNLRDTRISDAGLTQSKGLKQLQRLDTRGARTTEAGAKKLGESLLRVSILR